MNRQPLVYLACPYSHSDRSIRVRRFHAANRAAADLMKSGVMAVFSPISHTHSIAEAGGLPLGFEFWRQFDEAYLSVSNRLIVLTVDGWQESAGVCEEIRIAQELGIPIDYMEPVE
jgi:hypothetical protein